MNHVTHIVWFPHLVFLWDIPSSTQQTLVFWSPISTTQALLTPDPKDAQTDSYKNKQQSMSTTCTGICIKMHNYSKPCNCKHYFITCVSKGANINKYRNCFTRANHCSCWEPIINIRHAQLLKDGTKKSLVKCYRCTHLV